MRSALAWLADQLDEMEYGTVGLTFTIHRGKVKTTHRIKDECFGGDLTSA